MNNTYILQIGNSDNKLTQKEWSEYVNKIIIVVKRHSDEIHFSGGSSNWEPWQNYCMIFTLISEDKLSLFIKILTDIKNEFNQDSVALTIGNTQFLE